MNPTRVVCVRGTDPRQDPAFVYVGRAVPRARWAASVWGNPFMIGMTWGKAADFLTGPGREHMWTGPLDRFARRLRDFPGRLMTGFEAVQAYVQYVDSHPGLPDRLPELRGRKLGCWCGIWHGGPEVPEFACHAVALALMADGNRPGPNGLDRYLDTLYSCQHHGAPRPAARP